MPSVEDSVTQQARALDRVHRTRKARDTAQAAFHKAICRAVRTASMREVADAAGLSAASVHRIVHGGER